ncbi:FAD-dependent monooxygenase [Kitasatospora sp. NBC_00458]|uniref:FAD-dependent monooxygenase n=1 Tax=Kitasatospora sp. NBC_00458 TaxID=2903568 RepID=UPI002E1898AF
MTAAPGGSGDGGSREDGSRGGAPRGVEAPEVDAAVAGGGPAGAVAALVLACAGHRVLLLDDGGGAGAGAAGGTGGPRNDASRTDTSRTDAPRIGGFRIGEFLPPAARPLLRDLGLLDAFLAAGHPRSTGTLTAWGSAALHGRSHLFDPYGHGWHLDRVRFDAFLRDAAVAAGAELRPSTVLRRHADGRLVVRDRATGAVRELRSRWTVDATGRRCVIGRRHGLRHRQDRLVAAYAVFDVRRPGDGTDGRADGGTDGGAAQEADGGGGDREARTLVEAVPHGWWYTTLVPAGRLVAHLTDPDLADPALRTPEGFWHGITRTGHVRRRLAGYDPAATPLPRWTPAHGLRLDPVAGPGWVAAGDAALAFDPLSSQGILTALHTGARAGRAVAACLAAPGRTVAALADYTAFLDGIAAAYAGNHALSYRQEQRWPDHPFWRRRHTPRPPALTADR